MPITGNAMKNAYLRDLYMRGVRSGMKKAKQRCEANLFMRFLEHHFGTLPDHVIEKIINAKRSSIKIWTIRVLDGKTLDEVFLD